MADKTLITISLVEREGLCRRINDYLSTGGLFNPELAEHEAVRDLLLDCRTVLARKDNDE